MQCLDMGLHLKKGVKFGIQLQFVTLKFWI